ncbi:MAG TPA: exo-alpha-sialidase [Candidatus Dormibacteraeota bacterium]
MKRQTYVSVLSVLVLLVAAVVLAPSGAPLTAASFSQSDKAHQEPDSGGKSSAQTTNGNGNEPLGGPLSAAEQDFLNRAYPAADIPLVATKVAQRDFQNADQRGQQNGDVGNFTWTSIGPTVAQMPGVLTFTGAPFVTSGRISALAISPNCGEDECRLYVGAAGGGIWRTDNALSNQPSWRFISASFASNAIGTIVIDPTDHSGRTIYVGTGEPNASGDSEAGMGIYKSTNGGDSWSLVPGSTFAQGRAISSIVIDPANHNTLYVGITRAVRGVSSVTGGSGTSNPGFAPVGLYKSTNGGTSFSSVWDGNSTVRGVNHVELDPSNASIVYAAAFQQGIWRSEAAAAPGSFHQVFVPTSPGQNTDRTSFALTTKAGHTRAYVADGSVGGGAGGTYSQVWRNDNMNQAASVLVVGGANADGWTALTDPVNGNPGYATYNFCTGQCWYDNDILTPAGQPDTVFVIGSYQYTEYGFRSNGRAVLRSTTAGEPDPAHNNRTFTDLTWDATSVTTPNGIHPDQHALVFLPGNPNVWFEGSDGGLVRSSGAYVDASSQCAGRVMGPASHLTCQRLLSAIPTRLFSLNSGLNTLQFQHLAANPQNPTGELQGGTQDNGTWLYTGSRKVWNQTIYGDGGLSGYNAANPTIRFNTFFSEYTDTNFRGGDPTKWVVTSGPLLNSPEGSQFYMPIIADPNTAKAGSMFAGLQGVWRTTDNGGNQAFLEANCPEFTTDGAKATCGDWVELGGAAGDLTTTARGSKAGNFMAQVARASSDTGTLWAATGTGRVFISKNADGPAASVTWTRLDSLAPNSPTRFVSSIVVDPSNPNHAWIAYSGYNINNPTTPGHVFEVTYNGATATWKDLDGGTGPMGDLPVTAFARDPQNGDLYAGTDFGVLRLAAGSDTWEALSNGIPKVEVVYLLIPSGTHTLFAATHGRGAWQLDLPRGENGGGNGGGGGGGN